jgi:methyl-accepting chemotaxis protein
MRLLSDSKIRVKLAVLVGGAIAQLMLVGLLSVWALNTTHKAAEREEDESAKTVLANRIAAGMMRDTTLVGHIALSKGCERCHGSASGGDLDHTARIKDIRKDYLEQLERLKKTEENTKGRQLVGELEQAGTAWRTTNERVLDLVRGGKRDSAGTLYREESIPSWAPVETALKGYMDFEQPRLAEAKASTAAVADRMPYLVLSMVAVALAAAALFGVAITRSIAQPLAATAERIVAVGEGDISGEIEEKYLKRGDELGEMARAVRNMSVRLRDALGEIVSGIHVLSSSSSQLSASSAQMTSGSREGSERAHSVAAAATEMNQAVGAAAAGMEQTTSNLANVSIATEQMTIMIDDIARNSETARRITQEANREAARINEQMTLLGAAAREIGKVTETITDISSQTNLLALNATIEAARAGAAGKGFAVVANEIKTLAQQTAAATEDIKLRVGGVQTSAGAGIADIEKIAKVIDEVSGIVNSIAAAIEEQATVTKNIAQNIATASNGVNDANLQVTQTSQASHAIARDIASVDRNAEDMANGSEHVRAGADQVLKVANQLQMTVSRFRV